MLVRERTEADLAACAALARAVHERDGYPHYLPGPATAGPLTRRKPAEPLTGRLSRRVLMRPYRHGYRHFLTGIAQ